MVSGRLTGQNIYFKFNLASFLIPAPATSQFLTSTIMSEIDIHHVDPHMHPYVIAGRWRTFM